MQLLIILDAIKRSSPSRVTAVIPYYGYARQDRKHGPREPITAKLVADLISVAGPDRVLFLDLHAMQIQGFFDMPADDLKADTLITDYFNEQGLTAKNATIVAVNNGGARRVRRVALLTGAKIAIIETRQQGDVKVLNVVGALEENCIMYVFIFFRPTCPSSPISPLKGHYQSSLSPFKLYFSHTDVLRSLLLL